MAFLTVVKQWVENIWRVELTTRWAGGEDGTANVQAKQLAARTEYLKDFADEVLAAREGETSLFERINKSGVEPMKIMSKFEWAKDSPIVASTGNVNVSSGGLMAMDGINLSVGDLVLLKDQDDKRENGFWQVQTGAWNRLSGYQAKDKDALTYKLIFIRYGEANGGKVFFLDRDVYIIGESELIFAESIFSSRPGPGKVLIFDQNGESKLDAGAADLSSALEQGRNLLEVFKVDTVAEAMTEIRRRCNNNGEIDNTKFPDFKGIMIGDYLDLPSLNDGATEFVWNEEYKNLRIVVSAFNHYKNAGDIENTENHLVFTFRNCPLTRRMNATNTNTGGYAATELRTYLEGGFASGLRTAIGDYLYPIRRLLSTKGSWAWLTDTVFLPTEREVWGCPSWGEPEHDGGTTGQYPIYVATVYKGKRFNGSRHWHWVASPSASSAANFCNVNNNINANNNSASSAGGVAPDSVKVNYV
jgi:hypothetical protein